MNSSIEHTEAAQAAEFAAQQAVQREIWSRMEWWQSPRETLLVAVTRGDNASDNLRQVGVIWSKQ